MLLLIWQHTQDCAVLCHDDYVKGKVPSPPVFDLCKTLFVARWMDDSRLTMD